MLGLASDDTKIETVSKYNTFCSLCRKRITKRESCYTWKGSKFYVHLNCQTVKDRINNTYFRKHVKTRYAGTSPYGRRLENRSSRPKRVTTSSSKSIGSGAKRSLPRPEGGRNI